MLVARVTVDAVLGILACGTGEALLIVANVVRRIERCQFLKAPPYERTTERVVSANGFKSKTIMTRVGELTSDVLHVRGVKFRRLP